MLVKFVTSVSTQKNSYAMGQVVELDRELAERYIDDGIAFEYVVREPQGTLDITKNGIVDVSPYHFVNVQCRKIYVTFNANTKEEDNEEYTASVVLGDEMEDKEFTTIFETALPEGKACVGWADAKDAIEPNVEFPLKPERDVTVYAVFADAEEEINNDNDNSQG